MCKVFLSLVSNIQSKQTAKLGGVLLIRLICQPSIIMKCILYFFSNTPFSAACLIERQVPRPLAKKSKSQKRESTQEIQSWAGYGPGKRLGVVEASGCWAKSCPKGGRSSSPVIALAGGIESREAA